MWSNAFFFSLQLFWGMEDEISIASCVRILFDIAVTADPVSSFQDRL